MSFHNIRIFGVEINLLTIDTFFNYIENVLKLKHDQTKIIGYINIRGANLAYEHNRFKEFYANCDLVTCDGIGVLLGAKLLGNNVTFNKRFTAPDYLDRLLRKLSEDSKSIYFLSSTKEVIESAENIIKNKHPKLKFRTHNGYFKKKGLESDSVIADINKFKPDILYLGFGMPIQEYWILENISKLNCKLILPLGACLDFYTGKTYRGPKWLNDYGFEWLGRLITEPNRLWKRYLIGNPIFLIRILRMRFIK